MAYQENQPYELDRDMADSIRLEASVLEPGADRVLQQALAPRVIQSVIETHADFIPESTYARVKNLPQRIIITDTEAIDAFSGAWLPNAAPAKSSNGLYSDDGGLVLCRSSRSLTESWHSWPEEIKKTWIQAYGNEEDASEIYGRNRLGTTLIHEILHSFADQKGLFPDFEEHGVTFYSVGLTQSFNTFAMSSEELQVALLYKAFARDHGDVVHRVFFGSEPNESRVDHIHDAYATHISAQCNST